MKKLPLEFAGWYWAISNRCEKKYYADHYSGGVTPFTNSIGGRIVSQFFLDSPELLSIAYRYLDLNWNTQLWDLYPEKIKGVDTRANLHMNEISWLLFKSLAFNINLSVLDTLVDGDYQKLWDELSSKYEDKKEGQ